MFQGRATSRNVWGYLVFWCAATSLRI